MKLLVLSIVLVTAMTVSSQEISNTDLQKLEDLQLSSQNLDLTDLKIQKDLNQILFLEKKRKTNKTLAIVFTSAAAVSVIGGSIILSKGNNPNDSIDYADVIGGVFITGGVIYGGVSIPFWTASKKRKKERDSLLELY